MDMRILIHVCIYVCMYVHWSGSGRGCRGGGLLGDMPIVMSHVSIFVYIHMYVCMCIQVYIHMDMPIYIHVCIHVYIYTHWSGSALGCRGDG